MYRIVFEPTTARWLVQILSFHLFWRTVKTESEFKVFQEAQTFVNDVGLANVYRNYQDSVTHQIAQGGYQQWQRVPAVTRSQRAAG